MRIDEFSSNELGESHATIQELTSQIQELQEIDFYESFQRLSRCGIIFQWKIIPRSQSTGSCSKSSWYAEPRRKACDLMYGTRLVHRETSLAVHVQ